MQPNITRVRWSAENIPWGMSFDEKTGIFSGEPEEAGEYVVPVTVETNYGKDTKDVVIKAKVYGAGYVYVMGAGVNNNLLIDDNSVPDEYGFYPASNQPNDVVSLSRFPVGFRAHTASGEVYGASRGNIADKNIIGLVSGNYALNSYGKRYDVDGVTFIMKKSYRYGNYTHNFSIFAIAGRDSKTGAPIINDKFYDFYSNGVTSGGTSSSSIHVDSTPDSSFLLIEERALGIGTYEGGIRWLSSNGKYECRKEYTIKSSKLEGHADIIRHYLGYKAIKLITPAPYTYLSEDMLLDNNPDNFTHGTIKDAWGYNPLMYVQTTNNQLYEYTTDSGVWNLLGIYDIKKIEVQDNASMLMLTNDGKLFHKGNSLIGYATEKNNSRAEVILPSHKTLTHIYPSQRFIDFTYSQGNYTWMYGHTLAVLKEA